MKKWILIICAALMILGSSITCFAEEVSYKGETYYLQLPDGKRLATEHALDWGKEKIYIYADNTGINIMCNDGFYVLFPDGGYDGLLQKDWGYTDGSEIFLWNGGSGANYRFTYPFELGGVTINNIGEVDTIMSTSGQFKGVGVYRIYQDQIPEEATDFFRDPLQETVKVQQGKATMILTQMVSYLEFLVPWAIGLMAFMIGLVVLRKVLPRFL